MNLKFFLSATFCIHCLFNLNAQLKFLVEDFEGFADGTSDMKQNGMFTYGNIKTNIEHKNGPEQIYSGARYIAVTKEEQPAFGGWGKGVGLNIELNPAEDHFNFYVYQPISNGTTNIKIELQEDDDGNGVYEKDKDDNWTYVQEFSEKNSWQLVSVPLSKFKDDNEGGDKVFNITYKSGKLLCISISFPDLTSGEKKTSAKKIQTWFFDFICFSKGPLPVGKEIFDPSPASSEDLCSIGAWSNEAGVVNISEIPSGFENIFKAGSDKKIGVVHFFQPFAVDGGDKQNLYPSPERVNKIIQMGYIPMITLENHFVNAGQKLKQPNLYSITEGHFDEFFSAWAKQIKAVNGTVLLRILHEFNGDWYPWCISKNDNDPALFIKAYRHIHDVFKAQQVTNVKFIWCPNSMSIPQEKWNFILDAYPGNEYVDLVAMDTYNGAGKAYLWRSFRKEASENYFLLTQHFPGKPLIICEIASRERLSSEPKPSQNKAEWISQMSEALKSDMSAVRLFVWFNEKQFFKVNSSSEAENAFLKAVMQDNYFKGGTKYIFPLLKK